MHRCLPRPTSLNTPIAGRDTAVCGRERRFTQRHSGMFNDDHHTCTPTHPALAPTFSPIKRKAPLKRQHLGIDVLRCSISPSTHDHTAHYPTRMHDEWPIPPPVEMIRAPRPFLTMYTHRHGTTKPEYSQR
ncbi:hypothetical protein Hypma_014469 [Hypsizygus marmoreus]|uniref:Uncharacterized protein n=1 Tax=Hypsizygus marmoreus TaxID=39966 RepID=A0A369JEI1_HYPMA|nr:hypothetical protein Hypma_014469 [Hypsizygus marmoreus]